MKVLVVGGGGREHTLVWKISQSKDVDSIYCAPGNAGTAALAENVDISAEDVPRLLKFARENSIGLTIAGPEALRAARSHTSLPLVAIGGIDEHNAGAVLDAARCCICVCAAAIANQDVKAACSVLRSEIDNAFTKMDE